MKRNGVGDSELDPACRGSVLLSHKRIDLTKDCDASAHGTALLAISLVH